MSGVLSSWDTIHLKPQHLPEQTTDETKNTLEYALRAKNIRNRPEVNQKVSSATHMAHLSAENKRLKLELTAMREKDGVFMPLALCAPIPLHVFEMLLAWMCGDDKASLHAGMLRGSCMFHCSVNGPEKLAASQPRHRRFTLDICRWEKEQEEAKADRERRGELEAELEGIHGRHTAEREALEQQLSQRSAELTATQALLDKTNVSAAGCEITSHTLSCNKLWHQLPGSRPPRSVHPHVRHLYS